MWQLRRIQGRGPKFRRRIFLMKYHTTTMSVLGVLSLGCFIAVSPLSATAITGTANVAGNVVVTATSATFNPTLTVPPGSVETGSFVGLTSGTYNQTTLTGVGAVSVAPFITFSGGLATPVIFNLTTIMPGFGTLAGCTSGAIGAQCTPAGSPFTLIQSAGNTVSVVLTLLGDGFTGTAASGTSSTVGAYTTQVTTPGTIAGILAQLGTPGGSINQSYSATFTATNVIPEPASVLILGMGLLGIGVISRRRGAKV
jgi:hypothetical protein